MRKCLYLSLLFFVTIFSFNANAQSISYSELYTNSTFGRTTVDLTSNPVGTIEGASGTSPSGAATYTIPIQCAPGTNGMVPSLSIVYNSQGGNGILGQGWNLAGLSAITRAGWDDYHHGKVAPICYSNSDAFLLDGAYLYSAAGSYGGSGTKYTTEAESYSVTTSFGSVGGGPDYFTVVNKDGSTMEFGRSSTSKFYSDDGTKVMMWRINKIIDINGNYIEFEYDNSYRDSRISKIKYTGHTSGMLPYNEINFQYLERSDKNTVYDGGYTMQSKYLLWQIQVLSESEVFKTYQMDYGKNAHSASYLKFIQEFASDGSKLNDTRFKYGEEGISISETVNTDNLTSTPLTQISSGDFDGDGLSDFLIYEYFEDPLRHEIYHTNLKIKKRTLSSTTYNTICSLSFSGTGVRVENALKQSYYTQRKIVPLFSDFNGDGRDDIIVSNYNASSVIGGTYVNTLDYIHIYYTNSDGSLPGTASYIYTPPSIHTAIIKGTEDQENYLQIGDFDGDGAADFITMLGGKIYFHSPQKGITNKSITQVNLNSTTLSGGTMSWAFDLLFKDADDIFVVNMDGDAKSDLMVVTDGVTRIFTLNFDAVLYDLHLNQIGADLSYPTKSHDINLGDFNGDGKTDLLTGPISTLGSTSNWSVAYSDGKRFIEKPFVFDHAISNYNKSASSDYASDKLVIGDFNGDGKSDVLNLDLNYLTKKYHIYYSQGSSFTCKNYLTSYSAYLDGFFVAADFNGDAKSEILFHSKDLLYHTFGQHIFAGFDVNSKFHLLEKVTDGFNRTTEFAYEPLTKGTGSGSGDFYVKGTGETHPVNNVQYPLYVTTSIKNPDGIGGLTVSQYKYENLRLHRGGRGLLGFEKVKTISLNADVRTESVFDLNRTFYIPYLKTSKTFLNSSGLQLSQTDNAVAINLNTGSGGFLRAGGAYNFVQKTTGTTEKDLLKGLTIVSSYTYDGFTLGDGNGNIVNSTSTTTGGETFINTTSSTYIATGGSSIPNRPSLVVSTSKRGSQPTVSTDETFVYNAKGLLSETVSKPSGTATTPAVTQNMYYDDFGNLIRKTKSQHYSSYVPYTAFEYDSKGRFVITEENTFGHKKYFAIHKFWGKPLSVKGVNGLTTTYSYNSWGKLISTTIPTGPGTSYTINYSDAWDVSGNQLFYKLKQDPSAPDVKSWYDYLGRPIKVKEETFGGAWTEAKTNYDSRGNVSSSTNACLSSESPKITSNSYDAFNRLISSSSPLGTTSYNYTMGSGLEQTTITLPDGKISKTTTDALGKVVESSNGTKGGTLMFEYDSWGNEIATKMRGAFGPITTLITKSYSETGQLSEINDADAGKFIYKYDPCGRLISSLDPHSAYTEYHYDIADRMVLKKITKGPKVYEYRYKYFDADKDYRPMETKVDGPDGTVTEYFDYQVGGGITNYTKDINGTFLTKTFTYDAYNRPLECSYPIGIIPMPGGATVTTGSGSGFGTKNHYDINGFLTKITSNTSPAKTLYEATAMNGAGQITAFKRPGGLNNYIEYTYHMPTYFGTSGIQGLWMDYDYRNGNVLGRRDEMLFSPKVDETFAYDPLNRLTRSDVSNTISGVLGPVTTHSLLKTVYDSLMGGTMSYGRIVSKSDVGTYNYSGFPLNAVKEIVVAPGSSVISHETQNIEYNPFHKTQKITEKVGGLYYEEKMLYDADEDRAYTSQSQGSVPSSLAVTRQRWYMGDYEMQQIAGNTQYIHYIGSDAGLVAMVVKDGSGFHYYPVFTDHLGSIVKVTDEMGLTVAEQNYDAWGRERNPNTWDYDMTGTFAKPNWLYRGYTGHKMLPEYGLINMNGRMYDPANGRMLRPDNYVQDPLNSQNYNRYSYCWNNPLKYTDPDGNNPILIAMLVGAIWNLGSQYMAGNVMSFGQGLSYFCAGALSGGFTMGGGGPGAGGVALSLMNSAIRIHYSGQTLDMKQVVGDAVISGATAGVGAKLGPMLTPELSNISSPMLRMGLQNAVGSAATGFTFATVGALAFNGNPNQVLETTAYSFGMGFATGAAMSVPWSSANNVNPFSGRSTLRPQISDIGYLPSLGLQQPQGEGYTISTIPERGGLNLFKWGEKTTTTTQGWKTGDYMLHLPDKGTPALNWKANYGSLRREMNLGNPIYETFVHPDGALMSTGGFLNAERFTFQNRGWVYNPSQRAWLPPIK